MTMLTRWNPFKQWAQMDPVSDIEDIFRGLGLRSMMRDTSAPLEMRLDVVDDDKAYQVKVDVPGAKKEDIEVSIDGSRVSIRAEVRHETSEKKEGKEVHSERYFGSSFRSFTLPQEVDEAKALAHYDDGVLSLTLPKKSNGRSHRIAIN